MTNPKQYRFEPRSISLQCKKYLEIIATPSIADWASILGVPFIDQSNLYPTFMIHPATTPEWWNKIERVTEIHSNSKKLLFAFKMENNQVAGLRLTEIKTLWFFGFLRLIIEKEFGRSSTLKIEE